MVEWLFNGMCGINITHENEFNLSPIIGGNINHASASYNSIYGLISLSWKKDNNKVIIDIIVPSNTIAHFNYNNDIKDLYEGSYHFIYEE